MLTVILVNVVWNKTPEIFEKGSEIGKILSDLGLAYLSSWIFYLLIFVVKEKRDKQNVYMSAHPNTQSLVNRARMVYHLLIEGSDKKDEFRDIAPENVSKDQFDILCSSTNPSAIIPNKRLGNIQNSVEASYARWIYHNCIDEVQHYYNKIIVNDKLLDSEHIALLNKIRDSLFFNQMHIYAVTIRNTNFSTFSKEMYEYLQIANELDVLNKRLKNKYLVSERKLAYLILTGL